jgi:hypothetical protein
MSPRRGWGFLLESFGYKDSAPNGATAISIRHNRHELKDRHRAGFDVVGGFPPRVTVLFTECRGHAGMEFFQLALKSINIRGREFIP